MSPDPPDWSLYRAFAAVLREGSLSAAARRLGLSQPTLGRHVAALEEALGLPLFTRSRGGLTPTPAAEALRPEVEALVAATDSLLRKASGPLAENVGAVRITASEIVAAEVLPPVLAAIQAEHPGIVVELVVSNRIADLVRRDADIAVRTVRPSQGALLAKRVGAFELGLFAAPGYLARRPAPTTPAALARHALVGFDVPAPYTGTLRLGGRPLTRDAFSFRTDDDVAQFAAIRAGCGIGACHVPLARRAGLVRVLAGEFAPKVEMWLAMHEDLKASRRCRTVFDALWAGLGAYVGRGPARSRRARG
ncbi:LysR family transcriptional regulator [Nannocystis radixulma]|uniref:LysR family transcriptional regulator n=1 Tax=Nannocystis radixulma TaxID=2995305 RepID=A0ABT5BM12_9BACT|nr:LysR family transcriptional regulator [Nannocystis radixulma]MDC0674564.1 LysR family transcriptional regulator [Nannocystis radixulma]